MKREKKNHVPVSRRKPARRRKSLSKAVIRLVLAVAVMIFTVSVFLNWNFMNEAAASLLTMSGSVSAASTKGMTEVIDGFEDYVRNVMTLYRQMPETVRKEAGGETYRAVFSECESSFFYETANSLLNEEQKMAGFIDIYLAMFDRDTGAVVYLFDPLDSMLEKAFGAGDYEPVSVEEMDYFMPAGTDLQAYYKETRSFRSKSENGSGVLSVARPVFGESGDLIAFVMADVPVQFAQAIAVGITVVYVILMALLLLFLIIAARLGIQRRVVKPIREISGAAYAYLEGHKAGAVNKKYFSSMKIKTKDELQELGRVMSDMEDDISVYEKDLMKAAAEKERIQTELTVAADIQRDMLPNQFPAFPDRHDFDICASMDPAREVGGDFYDFFMIDDDHLGIVMADVSGKGIPAALFMMSSMLVISNFASLGYSPADVLQRSNDMICASNTMEMFVTVWFGILDLKTGTVTAANAGHEYPAVRHAGGSYELYEDRHGFVLGGMEGMRYYDYTLTLERGSSLFLYTDGVPEATDSREELYGTDRMISALNKAGDLPPEKVLRIVREDVDAFVKEAPQFDDLTMLCVTYLGPESL